MKNIIAFSFLLISVSAMAQKDILKDSVLKPVFTEMPLFTSPGIKKI